YDTLVGNPNRFNFDGETGDIVNHGNLAVPEGKNLNLVGGTVENTGNLSAPGGAVNIIAVPGSDRVRIQQNGMVLELEVNNDGQGMAATDLPKRLTGGTVNGEQILEVGEDGRVRLTTNPQTPRGTAIVQGTPDKPAQIQSDRVRIVGQEVQINHAVIHAQQELHIQSLQGQSTIRNTAVRLEDVAGIGGLLTVLGAQIEVEQSQFTVHSPATTVRFNSGSPIAPLNSAIDASLRGNTTLRQTRIQINPSAPSDKTAIDSLAAPHSRVEILGTGRVELLGTTIVSPEIYIGGDLQGGNALPAAQETIVDAASTLDARGFTSSELDPSGLPDLPDSPIPPLALAGRVIVWADDKTRFLGRLRNPAGFAEISGKRELDLGQGWVDRLQVGD
ncbi:MAG: hypothetical protein ACO3EZ_19645, partial [Prochlorotrichaceae cyanobacterium]